MDSPRVWESFVEKMCQILSRRVIDSSGCTSNLTKISSIRDSKQFMSLCRVPTRVSFEFNLPFSLFCETWVFFIYNRYRNTTRPRTTAALYDDMECGGTIDSSDEGFVNSSFISKEKIDRVLKHNLHLECMWMIKVREGFKVSSLLTEGKRIQSRSTLLSIFNYTFTRHWQFSSSFTQFPLIGPHQILLYFRHFHLEKPNDCESNVVDVFGEKTDILSRWVGV